MSKCRAAACPFGSNVGFEYERLCHGRRLTMRLSDAAAQRRTKVLDPNHRLPSLAHRRCHRRDRSNLGLDYRAMPAPKLPSNSAEELTPSLALRKDPTDESATAAQRRLLNTVLTPVSHAPSRGPNQDPFASVPPRLAALAR
jgi:hypothetical protein